MDKFEIKSTSTHVTYTGDTVFPDTEYGEAVEIVVSADLTVDPVDVVKTITIRIGDNTFLPSEISAWLEMVERANTFANMVK